MVIDKSSIMKNRSQFEEKRFYLLLRTYPQVDQLCSSCLLKRVVPYSIISVYKMLTPTYGEENCHLPWLLIFNFSTPSICYLSFSNIWSFSSPHRISICSTLFHYQGMLKLEKTTIRFLSYYTPRNLLLIYNF